MVTFTREEVSFPGDHPGTSCPRTARAIARSRRARLAGTELVVPCVAELLADTAFEPLARRLDQRQVPLADLQTAVDQFLAQAQQ